MEHSAMVKFVQILIQGLCSLQISIHINIVSHEIMRGIMVA